MLDRRSCLAALAGLSASRALAADRPKTETPRTRLFTSGPLANNALAQHFDVPAIAKSWPAARMRGPQGVRQIEDFRGKVLIAVLWAEWCPWCRIELPALRYHADKFNSDSFQMLPVLTGSSFTKPAEATQFLERIGAKGMPVYVDTSTDRNKLMRALGADPDDPARGLPFTLILDSTGKIRGECRGSPLVTLASGEEGSLWNTNVAEAFVGQLARSGLPPI